MKVELRGKNIDIYKTKWQILEPWDIDEDSRWDSPEYRFVDEFTNQSTAVDSIIEYWISEEQRDEYSRLDIPDYIESAHFPVDDCSDLEQDLVNANKFSPAAHCECQATE